MIVVVTGADGFIGREACAALERAGHQVRRLVRRSEGPGASRLAVADIAAVEDWRPVVAGADVVVHLAARAHVMKSQRDEADAFHRTNVQATELLARHSVDAAVRRFVFMSSIGVNGSSTSTKPFEETDEPRPVEPYARSKLQAEQRLREIAGAASLETVILRPPLVYGPSAKGNFLRLMRLAISGLPLPLASLSNRRNLVGLTNLCDAIVLSVTTPAAAMQTFLIAEPEPKSTADVLRALYVAFGMRDRLFRFPPWVLEMAARAAGRGREFEKMCSSLEIDSRKAMRELGWRPRLSFGDEIAASARWFTEQRP